MDFTLVLISTGIFQEYVIYNIEQLLRLEYKVHVITEKEYFDNLQKFGNKITKIDTKDVEGNFESKSKLDKIFRNGFWHNASKRLFILYEYMKKYNIQNVIHLENDVLLYSNLNYKFEDKVYLVMDTPHRCIPGIIYIPRYNLLDELIKNYDYTLDDMLNMGEFYNSHRDKVTTFPIINDYYSICTYNVNFQEFNSIFDGAAMGQYLGGVDPRNITGDTIGFVNETCLVKYNIFKFKWFRKGEYSFPYLIVNNNIIPINNLHIHSKNLQNFVINYKNNIDMDFITGEKIESLCNHLIGYKSHYEVNPNLLNWMTTFIEFDSINNEIDNKPYVFTFTHNLQYIEKLVNTLKYFKNPFSLVFHNSDNNFEKNHLILFKSLPKLKKIFTQNMNVVDDRVIPLPIGLANSMWPHGNSTIHTEIYNTDISKTKNIYFNFNINTNFVLRKECFDKINKKNIPWNENKPYREYLIELKSHKYSICPEGNGIDTHRFWECLYMNTIPICKKNILVEYYKEYFPIIILDDWDDLDIEYLDKKYDSLIIDHKYIDLQFIKSILS